jgi:hypothetical protein
MPTWREQSERSTRGTVSAPREKVAQAAAAPAGGRLGRMCEEQTGRAVPAAMSGACALRRPCCACIYQPGGTAVIAGQCMVRCTCVRWTHKTEKNVCGTGDVPHPHMFACLVAHRGVSCPDAAGAWSATGGAARSRPRLAHKCVCPSVSGGVDVAFTVSPFWHHTSGSQHRAWQLCGCSPNARSPPTL